MTGTSVDPHLFIIFGSTSNLAYRKLLPAFYHLLVERGLKDLCQVLGVATKDIGDEGYRDFAQKALEDAGFSSDEVSRWCNSCVHYQAVGKSEKSYTALAARIKDLEKEYNLPGNRVFYLALPPSIFPAAITGLGEAGLNKSSGWVRLVIEKPFGYDLASAQDLNQLVHRYFDENQIFRIDHYLGKETVQNLLVFRFANTIFESLWNRDKVESIQITMAESMGIEERASYYEKAGALRDIVQNHLTQLLTLIAVEVPAVFEPEYIRNEKVKVLHSIAGIRPEDVIFGQYEKGRIDDKEVLGYREEQGVASDSSTETFVALKLEIDNWRWQGVPFYLRTGKRLPQRITQVAVNFRHPPVCIFQPYSSCQIHSNRLLINLQPDGGFHMFFDVKEPEEPLRLKTERLHFHYEQAFGKLPDAYQTLIHDILKGDQTLFVRSDEVEVAWQLFTPLLERDIPAHPYEAGTWGPEKAEKLMTRDGRQWVNQ